MLASGGKYYTDHLPLVGKLLCGRDIYTDEGDIHIDKMLKLRTLDIQIETDCSEIDAVCCLSIPLSTFW